MFPLACPTTCVPGWSLGYQPSLRWGLPILHEAGLGGVPGYINPQTLHEFTGFFFFSKSDGLIREDAFFGDFLVNPSISQSICMVAFGAKAGLLGGSYSGSSGVGERFWLLLHPDKSEHLLAKVPQFWKRPKKLSNLFSEHGASLGRSIWRPRWPCDHLGHLETTDLGSSMLRGGIGPRQVEFLQKRMDENPQYQGLVAFTNLHDPGGLRLVGSHQVDVCHEFLTVSYFMYIV